MHSALDKFLDTPEYHIHEAVVLSNEQKVYTENSITYMPIYYCMFFNNEIEDSNLVIPEIQMPDM